MAIPDFWVHVVLPKLKKLFVRMILTSLRMNAVGMSFGICVGKVRNHFSSISMLCVGFMLVYMLVASSLNSFAFLGSFPRFSRSVLTLSDRWV